jgi:hypothetical protein
VNITGSYISSAYGNAFVNNVLKFGLSYYGSFGNIPCNKLNFYPLVGYGHGIGMGSSGVEYFTGGLYGTGTHIFYTNSSDTSVGTERMRITSTGVGIGTTNPTTAKLVISGTPGATGLDMVSTDQYTEMRVIRNSLSSIDKHMYIGYGSGSGSKVHFYSNNTDTMSCDGGNVVINNNLNVYSINTNNIASSGTNGPLTIDPNFTTNNYVVIYDQLSVQGNQNISGDLFVTGQVVTGLYVVSSTNTDYCYVQQNFSSIGQYYQLAIKVAYGSFTVFHRCYTDDELYGETDETKDVFRNKYIGRVVIATGKIKTDFTRLKPTEPEPEPEPVIDSETGEPIIENKLPKIEEDEWYTEIDKDGITIEVAVPIVRLSRQKKDK